MEAGKERGMTPPRPSPNSTSNLFLHCPNFLVEFGEGAPPPKEAEAGGVYHPFLFFFCGGCITGPPGVPGCASAGRDGSGGGFTKDEA